MSCAASAHAQIPQKAWKGPSALIQTSQSWHYHTMPQEPTGAGTHCSIGPNALDLPAGEMYLYQTQIGMQPRLAQPLFFLLASPHSVHTHCHATHLNMARMQLQCEEMLTSQEEKRS